MMADTLPTLLPRRAPGGRWRRVDWARFCALGAVSSLPPLISNDDLGYREWWLPGPGGLSRQRAAVLEGPFAGFYEWMTEAGS